MKKITRFLASLAAIFVMMLLCEVSVFAYSTTRSNTQDITYIARKNMTVTFTVENGTFEDGSTDPITFSVPYGKTLSLNQIPTNMKPAVGYTAHGSWSPAIPDTSTEITKDITYTYSFRPPVVTYHANAKDAVFAGGKDTHIVGYIQNDKTNKNDVAKGYEYQDPSRKTYRLMSWNYTPDGTGKTFDINTAKITDDIDVYAVWKKKEATFIDGPAFHDKILSLSHNAKGNSFSAGSYRMVNTNIEAIKHASQIPEKYKTSTNLVSTQDSDYKIYAWFVEDKPDGEGTLYWWSEATADGEPTYMNADAGSMFSCLWKLKDISGLADMDTSRTTSFSELFYSCPSLSNISPIARWNTSKVTNLNWLFGGANWTPNLWGPDTPKIGCLSLRNLDALKNWDVHNVKSCWRMLTGAYYLKDISGIKNWNLPVELFKDNDNNAMFQYTSFQYPIPVFNKFTGIINGQSYQMGSVIRLHMNGGTYTYSRTGSKYDDPFDYTVSEFDICGWKASKLSAYKPVREGHTFLYWNTKQDGTGKTYLPTDMSPVYNRDDCKVYDLYAIWDSPAPTKMNATNSCNN